MASNIEIKARAHNFSQLQQIARQLSNERGILITQEDTFFTTPNGRLKLRVLDSQHGELIFYQRADQEGPRPSHYFIAHTDDPASLKNVLSAALPIYGIVRKQRLLYLIGQTRIHLDEVNGLGQFIELEYVLRPEEDPQAGQKEVQALLEKFEIQPRDFVPQAYVDLLNQQGESESNAWVRYWSRKGSLYDNYIRFVAGDDVLSQMRTVLRNEESLGHMLELGCGTGFFTRFVADKATQITATDLSDELLAIAQRRLRRLGNANFKQANSEQIPFPNESFDSVFMSNLITIVNARKTLTECQRVLRPGGRLLIVNLVLRRMEWPNKLMLVGRTLLKFGIPPLGRKDYSPEKLATLVSEAGFKIHTARLMGQRNKFVYLRASKS